MTIEDKLNGWDDIPIKDEWLCPKCDKLSDVALWKYTEVGCDLCGSHEARRCPLCDEVFDCVWGVMDLVEANKK